VCHVAQLCGLESETKGEVAWIMRPPPKEDPLGRLAGKMLRNTNPKSLSTVQRTTLRRKKWMGSQKGAEQAPERQGDSHL